MHRELLVDSSIDVRQDLIHCISVRTHMNYVASANYLQIEQTDLLHLFESWDDPLLITQLLHTALEPLQLLRLSLLHNNHSLILTYMYTTISPYTNALSTHTTVKVNFQTRTTTLHPLISNGLGLRQIHTYIITLQYSVRMSTNRKLTKSCSRFVGMV